MRRPATLALLSGIILALAGCTGFGEFVDHTFTLPGTIRTLPMADSENVRRAMGQPAEIEPLGPEPGNVWPAKEAPEPGLAKTMFCRPLTAVSGPNLRPSSRWLANP